MKAGIRRALIEVGFIIFLFYSNLLMGEFEHSGLGRAKGLDWALHDIFTDYNFAIALMAGLVGFLILDFLRARF